MRITIVSRPGRKGPVSVYRPHLDQHSPLYGDRRRHLVISAPYGMPAAEVLMAIEEQLDDQELVEVAEALGLHES